MALTAATCSRWFLARRLFSSSTLKMEAIRSFEMSVYTICTRRHIPEDKVLQVISRMLTLSYYLLLLIINIKMGKIRSRDLPKGRSPRVYVIISLS
jgi:hypothetical protein